MIKKRLEKKTCACCESESEYHVTTCDHLLCKPCLTQMCQKQSKQKKQSTVLNCPIDKCNGKINLTELLKVLTFANECNKCKVEVPYTCDPCILREIEEVAKVNFYSKQLKFEQLVNLEQQPALHDQILKNELICSICKEFNQTPVIVCQMGHEICKGCYHNIRSFSDTNQVCPMCKQDLLTQPPNQLRALNLIQNLEIHCGKCNQDIKYREFVQSHYRKCQESTILCQGCQEQVEVQFYEIHRTNYCLSTGCPFTCDRKISDHRNNFILEHLISTMKKSDVSHTMMLRMQVVERFLFTGQFGFCLQCDQLGAWQIDNGGNTETFCFQCFKLV